MMKSLKDFSTNSELQKKEFMTVINPRKLTPISNKKENMDRTTLVSWLFLIGSLIFLLDGFLELIEGVSLHAILHNAASLLFTIGSIFFLLDAKQN